MKALRYDMHRGDWMFRDGKRKWRITESDMWRMNREFDAAGTDREFVDWISDAVQNMTEEANDGE